MLDIPETGKIHLAKPSGVPEKAKKGVATLSGTPEKDKKPLATLSGTPERTKMGLEPVSQNRETIILLKIFLVPDILIGKLHLSLYGDGRFRGLCGYTLR